MLNTRPQPTDIEEYHFSPAKYEALAFQRPAGLDLLREVEEHWLDWVHIVEKAPWRSYWKHSPYIEVDGLVRTPTGRAINSRSAWAHVALCILALATWGYGVAGWLRGQTSEKALASSKALGAIILVRSDRLKACMYGSADSEIFIDTGYIVPLEIGTLDRWLEPIWRQVKARIS